MKIKSRQPQVKEKRGLCQQTCSKTTAKDLWKSEIISETLKMSGMRLQQNDTVYMATAEQRKDNSETDKEVRLLHSTWSGQILSRL